MKIQIPSSVEFIGAHCFGASLCEVTIDAGSKLERIEESAFAGTGVTKIQIPWSVEFIGENCFCGCESLCEVIFEPGSLLKEIGDSAFARTGLKRIEIPARCEVVSGSLWVDVGEVNICDENRFLVKEASFMKSSDNKRLIRYMGRESWIGVEMITEIISAGCFYKCESVCEVTIDAGSKLRRIEWQAFSETCVRKIQIPSSVEFIG
jgi:hypothetical protein